MTIFIMGTMEGEWFGILGRILFVYFHSVLHWSYVSCKQKNIVRKTTLSFLLFPRVLTWIVRAKQLLPAASPSTSDMALPFTLRHFTQAGVLVKGWGAVIRSADLRLGSSPRASVSMKAQPREPCQITSLAVVVGDLALPHVLLSASAVGEVAFSSEMASANYFCLSYLSCSPTEMGTLNGPTRARPDFTTTLLRSKVTWNQKKICLSPRLESQPSVLCDFEQVT